MASKGRPENLIPFKSGPEWKGNAGGRPKGLTRLMKELLAKRELCGEVVPGGRTVEEALVEAILHHAIKGSPTHLQQVWDRLEGKAGESYGAADRLRAVFEIIPNGRDALPGPKASIDDTTDQPIEGNERGESA